MNIYTKAGDGGNTSLLGGSRIPKYDIRIEAYGTVDELNSFLGHLGDQEEVKPFQPFIQSIQDSLFTWGSHLAADPQKTKVKLPEITGCNTPSLEQSIDEMEAKLPALKNFILPGGHPANSLAHVCRSICRRAERRIAELHHNAPIHPDILPFFNRLSDWLFVFARYISLQTHAQEINWDPGNRNVSSTP
ncbi:MAG: cob(I)yrinic acid a,c-diamide adenosyltransferase [Bacteroidota bacterium]